MQLRHGIYFSRMSASGRLKDAETREIDDLRAHMVAPDCLPHHMEEFVAVVCGFHFYKINENLAGQVPKTDLAADLGGSLDVDAPVGLLRDPSLRAPPCVDSR